MDTRPDHVTVRTLPAVLGWGAGLAVAQGVFDYTGGKFSGYDKDPNVDEYEQMQAIRSQHRRPVQETLDLLGEGRGELSFGTLRNRYFLTTAGIYGPGYRERRAERIKETYGIDVPRN